jgi:cell wall-associated NlpC family hydrolase
MAKPAAYVEAARTYLGVRWHHLGRDRHGVDCVGLLLAAADDCAIPHTKPPPYPRGHRGFDLIAACALIGNEVRIPDAQDGDILLFTDSLFPCHMGIRTTKHDVPHVIHAHAVRRKVLEEPLIGELERALRKVYRPTAFESN